MQFDVRAASTRIIPRQPASLLFYGSKLSLLRAVYDPVRKRVDNLVTYDVQQDYQISSVHNFMIYQ